MIKNYLKIALRNFKRHKLFTAINVIGLSIGISAALVIYLIVSYDFNFDTFHPNGNRIYRVVTDYTFSGEPAYNGGVSGPMPAAIQTEVKGIEKVAPFYTLYQSKVSLPGSGNNVTKFKKEDNVVLADGRYFDIFKYKWLAGDPKTALNAPGKVVITDAQAKKYFPNLSVDQVIGRIVVYEDTIKTAVTGVVQAFDKSTDFTFHDFISYSTGVNNSLLNQDMGFKNWGGTSSQSQCYVLLMPQTPVAAVEKQLDQMVRRHNPPRPEDKGIKRHQRLQPLDDVHFNEKYNVYDTSHTANKNTLYGLLIIAAFLMVLGCINFINLTTAQASQRAKEIGIRKTIGSTRNQLILQLLSETFLITLFAVIIAVVAAPLILKLFADFVDPGVKFSVIQNPEIVVFLLVLTIVVSLLSGFYPAIVLSNYKPVQVMKNQASAGSGKTRNMVLRKSLTVTQFIIAQFFIMATILVSKQIYFAVHKDMGFKKDAIVYFSSPWKNNSENLKQLMLNKLNAIPQVEMVSRGGAPPSYSGTNSTEATYINGKKEIKSDLYLKYADTNYIKLYHIKLLAGRNIRTTDTNRAFIINAHYARLIGFKNPADAVGKTVDKFNGDKRMLICGVVADFAQGSVHMPQKPLAIVMYQGKYNNGTFHIALKPETPGGNQWKTAIAAIQDAWKTVYPEDDFEYHFFDDSIAKFYVTEQHVSQLLTWAAGLSIFISCLGLLGLAMYTTNMRTKEIGVRKVLGASVTQIVALLSTELVVLIVISFAVVTPIAWWSMHRWMEGFADRTSISWWIFAISGAGMLVTALITLSSQTVRAAVANPVKSLRSE